MKDNLIMETLAALVEWHTTPRLEDSVNNEEGGYEMNTKHTPGPWRHCPPSSTSFCIETPKGGILCSCSGLPDPKEWEANAALIAAAPTAPHICDDPACPGHRNKIMLDAFQALFTDQAPEMTSLFEAAPALLKALEMIASAHTTDEFAKRCARAAIEEVAK